MSPFFFFVALSLCGLLVVYALGRLVIGVATLSARMSAALHGVRA